MIDFCLFANKSYIQATEPLKSMIWGPWVKALGGLGSTCVGMLELLGVMLWILGAMTRILGQPWGALGNLGEP